jgi:uncharacterized protein YrzB (UPF0473 family)
MPQKEGCHMSENPTREADGELSDIIILNDEAGNEVSFEFLDLIEYQEHQYDVLLPVAEDVSEDEDSEVVILMLAPSDNEEEECYLSVEDEETLLAVFDLFKVRFQDEFNFAE